MSRMRPIRRARQGSWVTKRLTGDNAGFTLLEVLVAGFVLVVGLVFIAQFFASAIGSVTDSETRSLIHQVASQEIEKARALDYADIGTVGGHPAGLLLASETVTVEDVSLVITREVIYVEDPSYSGPYPANYRRVTIRVQVDGDSRLGPVELATLVAGGAAGGSLDIRVTNARGEPVPDVLLSVENNHLIPNVHINSSAIRTDSQGRLLVPGLRPDPTTAYYVEGTKTGYNSAWTDPMVVVNEGLPYTVIQFIMDRLSTLNIHVVDELGSPVPGVNMTVTGPRGFSQNIQSDGGGLHSLVDIGFSTSGNPYVIAVNSGQGYQPVSTSVALEPGITQDVTIVVVSNIVTTTTTVAPPTTTTTVGTGTTTTTLSTTTTTVLSTSTTIGFGSVLVQVMRWRDGRLRPVENASVTLYGTPQMTNSAGEVTFSNVPFGTYDLLVTKNDYHDYRSTVLVNGSEVVPVTLVRN
jgi:type II secretory pathway pseudopilin PulG